MFPGAHASIIRNEAGEPLGWDYPDYDKPYEPADEEYGRDEDWCKKHGCWTWNEDCTCGDAECDHPEWVAGMAVVAKEDLETVRLLGAAGPRCKYCDVLYEPEVHGFCAGIYD